MSSNKKHMKGGMNTSYSNVNTDDQKNKNAEDLLFQAWNAAGYYGKPDEDFYPRTAKETKDMDALLTQAKAAVDDSSDTELMDAMAETHAVIEWSKKRHWTFAWWIVICVIIAGFYNFFEASNVQKAAEQRIAVPEEELSVKLAQEIQQHQRDIAYHDSLLKISTLSDDQREWSEEGYIYHKKEIERIGTTTQKYKEYILDCAKDDVWVERWEGIWCLIWIVLYIFACRPRGYMITKRRREDKLATGFKKILFGIAGGLVGAAGALQVTEIITKWSDGSKTRDNDALMITALKIALIVGAVVLVIVVARILIVIATLLGLFRNYDWKQIVKDPKSMIADMK